MATRSLYTAVALETLTAANLNTLAKGWLGLASTSTDQTSISTTTDLTGLSVTVTVPADRMIRITASVPVSSDTANDRLFMSIREDSTTLAGGQLDAAQATLPYTIHATAVLDGPSAGSHTYKLTVGLGGSATGPMQTNHTASGGSTSSRILVEDIGPASS